MIAQPAAIYYLRGESWAKQMMQRSAVHAHWMLPEEHAKLAIE